MENKKYNYLYTYIEQDIDILIKFLPRDIQLKIYGEYFYYDYVYHIMDKKLKLYESQRLNTVHIDKLVRYILQNNKLTIYFREKNEIFNLLYNDHYIRDDKNFKQLKIIDSFILAWLFYLYH